jgi:hypothetical protein
MNITIIAGITLILSTLIYHGGLVLLFTKAQFGEILKLSRNEKLLIIARHTAAYLLGFRIVLIGWIAAVLGYVMLTILLRDSGDSVISTLAVVLFLVGIISVIGFWALHLPVTLLAAEETARTTRVPEYYESLQRAADTFIGIYNLLTLLATAGFGWALLRTSFLPGWVGWMTLGWGVLWVLAFLKNSEGIPLLPMVMPIVIGASLLLKC